MKLPNNYPRNICAYCGNTGKLSDDHIPPKNLFPKPRPNNLITVSACSECHSDTSKDDEYFKNKLSLRNDAGEHPSARANWDSIFRSLNRYEAKGLKKSFIKDLRNVHMQTKAGIYIGEHLGFHVNMIRIRRVVERVVRGFYFAESFQPLGQNNNVNVLSDDDLINESEEVIEELTQNILLPLASIEPKIIGDNIFTYRHHITDENPAYSVWGLSFYGHVPFFCITGPKN